MQPCLLVWQQWRSLPGKARAKCHLCAHYCKTSNLSHLRCERLLLKCDLCVSQLAAAPRQNPITLKKRLNLRSPAQMRPIKIPLIGGGPLWNHRSLCISNISRQLILSCLLSGRRENMRAVSGARGPLNCHGQSSRPIRRYGGALAFLTPTTWEQN